jgi:hypothetical protein
MTRFQPGEPVVVKPGNNIYTALAGVALVASLIAIIVLVVRHSTVFGASLFS